MPPYLVGAFERDNRERGYMDAIPDVLMVASGRYITREEIGAGLAPLVSPIAFDEPKPLALYVPAR